MKKVRQIIYLLLAVIGLSACGNTVTIETAENFEQVELPDSSVVYLNQNSKLSYDENFSPRRVKLEGEAFFSINDGETPFVVETEEGDEVTVLGTEFNLVASVKVVVIEVEIGLVSLRIGNAKIFREVRRGQYLNYGRHDNGLHLGQAKHQHRTWIKAMNKNFAKSGRVLKRSNKHAGKNFKDSNKSIRKGNGGVLKGGGNPKLKGKDGSPSKAKSKSDSKGSKDGGAKNKKGTKGKN